MKYSTQDLLLADALRQSAAELKGKEAAARFPYSSDTQAQDVLADRKAWMEVQPDAEYVLRALASLEAIAAMFIPSP